MALNERICRLRTNAQLSQEAFADIFHVSRQSVQKWENGSATPELSKIIDMARYFDVSLDQLVLGMDKRAVECMEYGKIPRPQYANMPEWELYVSDILIEYQQSIEEGLDISAYQELFRAVSALPAGDIKKQLGDVLFDIVRYAHPAADYAYQEPSEAQNLREMAGSVSAIQYDKDRVQTSRNTEAPFVRTLEKLWTLEKKIAGAWMGRICGCMLGKSLESIRTNELIPFLKETDNYPMHRYVYKSEITDDRCKRYPYFNTNHICVDETDGMPVDDDTNYIVLAQQLIENYGKDFTPDDVSLTWLQYQSKNAYCTAERVAFCNFVKGYKPPQSAVYQNPYREWIGAQIRGDYFGYINPGDPELAAEMAWRDASISHVKNGIYGEMFVAAMLAAAAVNEDIVQVIEAGLSEIPETSRLYEAIQKILAMYSNGASEEAVFAEIHRQYDEYTPHGWCHTIPNAMIVAAALLYGHGDYGRTICMAVQTGFDTDCNGATAGSVLGMIKGIDSIPEYWKEPMHDMLHTSIFQVGTIRISDGVKKTLEHIHMLHNQK